MSSFVVDPTHCGRGVGPLLMEYNTAELDRRGIKAFVEASELGRAAYERAGYQVVMKIATYIPAGKSQLWKKFYHEMALQPNYAMWQPKFGKISPGDRIKPWQSGPSIPID